MRAIRRSPLRWRSSTPASVSTSERSSTPSARPIRPRRPIRDPVSSSIASNSSWRPGRSPRSRECDMRGRQSTPSDSRRFPRWTVLVALAVVIGLGGLAAFLLLRGGTTTGFSPLTGRWLRLEGGYILEIRAVDAGGRIDATYPNPRPITVAKAEATRKGRALEVFIELQAPGYPGSTYTLTYEPGNDQLAGVYYQAALQQSFDVRFVRLK